MIELGQALPYLVAAGGIGYGGALIYCLMKENDRYLDEYFPLDHNRRKTLFEVHVPFTKLGIRLDFTPRENFDITW